MNEREHLPIPAEARRLIDALLDRELDDAGRARLNHLARRDPRIAEELVRARAAVRALSAPDLSAPDLSSAILREVAARGAIAPPARRWRTHAGRVLLAASVVLGFAGIATLQRVAPELTNLTGQPAPLASVVESTRADTGAGVRTLVASVRDAVETIAPEPNPSDEAVTAGAAALAEGVQRARTMVIRSGALDADWTLSRAIALRPLTGGEHPRDRLAAVTWAGEPGHTPVFLPLGVACSHPAGAATVSSDGFIRPRTDALVLRPGAVGATLRASDLTTPGASGTP